METEHFGSWNVFWPTRILDQHLMPVIDKYAQKCMLWSRNWSEFKCLIIGKILAFRLLNEVYFKWNLHSVKSFACILVSTTTLGIYWSIKIEMVNHSNMYTLYIYIYIYLLYIVVVIAIFHLLCSLEATACKRDNIYVSMQKDSADTNQKKMRVFHSFVN